MNKISKLREQLESYEPNPRFPDDEYAITCLYGALLAVSKGNFGIGCVIVDQFGRAVARGHNEVFHPHFQSSRHAEMVAMNKFEDAFHEDVISMRNYTLYTSVESCPMCMARLATSGVGQVLHIADDEQGGMVHLANRLPPVWQTFIRPPRQKWGKAKCSPELRKLAMDIFLSNVRELDKKLRNR